MWCWCIMVVVALMAHPASASDQDFLLNDCRVEGEFGNLKFTTYDDTVSLQLTRNNAYYAPTVVIRQGYNVKRFILHDARKPYTWQDIKLKLSEKPYILMNKKQVNGTGSQQEMKKKTWEVEIENAMVYARCEKRWPVFAHDSAGNRRHIEIPRSGDNEKIKLLPIEATIVRLTVGEEEKVICQEGDHVVMKDYDARQTCQKLNPNTFTEEINITVNNANKKIKILTESLTGMLYIVQCVDACVLPSADRQEVLDYQQQPETFQSFTELLARVSQLGIGKMREDLADLNRTIIQHIHTSDELLTTLVANAIRSVGEREIQQQLLASLNTTLVHHVARMESNKEELQKVQSSLNNTVTLQGHDEQLQQLHSDIKSLNKTITDYVRNCNDNEEGDVVLNEDCSIIECQQGYFRPNRATGARAANINFSDLLAKNCIHLNRTAMTWDDARANCVALGGDLFVAGDLTGATNYIEEQIPNSNIWAGVKAQAWSDGRTVSQEEWGPGEPNGRFDFCSSLNNNGVSDSPCSYAYSSLCQKRVSYGPPQ